ncbi:MAG: glycosyltransferase family 4 protein [Parvularcula sp.]|jgi:glycosyltransferase involved in cell wall biosynthesis|nr:glycosyltransferase family 4 protein [Parvularcula sp.]
MKIGYLSNHNPFDKNSFSSTSYYMSQALRSNPKCTVRILGNWRRPNRIIDKVWKPAPRPSSLTATDFDGLDAVLSLVSTDLVSKYGSLTNIPIVHCTDATPGFLNDFYGYDLPTEVFERERDAYEAASLILFSSEFMLERALSEFGSAYADKVVALPWGANLDVLPSAPPQKPPIEPLKLLFMGKEWARKGGDIVIEAFRKLQSRGIAAELHLVGGKANDVATIENVIDHGYLDKNSRKDRLTLRNLLKDVHFLLLPTRADCTPMVVAEANSYGIPVIATNVGGIPSLMEPGENGDMLSLEADASDYANRLMDLSANREQYEALSRNSFRYFKRNLTWDSWSTSVIQVLHEGLGRDGIARA